MSVDLSKKPFYLNKDQVKWVNDTKNKMTVEEKIGQLFFMIAADIKSETLEVIGKIKPGGVMLRPMKVKGIIKGHTKMQANSKIPMFLAANLEAGPNGLAEEGTEIGNEMLVAATNNVDNAFKLGEACIKEAKALGGNMAFAPLIDINFNWENPIANIRCFGDNIDLISQTIEDFRKQYDLIIYFINKQTKSNQTNIRVEYKSMGGFDSPWFVKEIPTMMISVGNPYHQYDLENVETVINAYSGTDEVIESLVEKIVGKSEFKGVSPVKLEFKPFVGDISRWK